MPPQRESDAGVIGKRVVAGAGHRQRNRIVAHAGGAEQRQLFLHAFHGPACAMAVAGHKVV